MTDPVPASADVADDTSSTPPSRRSLATLRGIWWRRGLSGMIFVVAVIAAAAATTGPVYDAAAKQSIVQDDLHAAPPLGQGVEASVQGPVPNLLPHVSGQVAAALHASRRPGLFGKPIRAMELGPTTVGKHTQATNVVWRQGACGHVTFVTGRCPRGAHEAIVSAKLAGLDHFRVGSKLPYGRLTVVGTYRTAHPHARYWYGSDYFPQQGTSGVNPFLGGGATPVDATFVARSHFSSLSSPAQGVAIVDVPVRLGAVGAQDVGGLKATVSHVLGNLRRNGVTAASSLPTVLRNVEDSWRALLVPIVLITVQLLALAWLLLFLVVTDAAEARGPEVALAKLRGFSRARSARFGLAEPVLLLLVALPIGAVVGWGATAGLAGVLLRAGTPVSLVPLGWAAAAVAVAGGLAAAVLAARRTIARPVVAQWQRAARTMARRTWIADAVLLTGAAAALADLFGAGTIGRASTNVLALLVPGLVAIAIAVVASRALPLMGKAAYRLTRRRGGIGAFLAVRQIARRPNGARTTIVLATAFGLAAFAIGAWSVSQNNLRDVAKTRTGAAAVLTVHPPRHGSLPAVVRRLDPSGRQAMAVTSYVDFAHQARDLYAVNPARFAHIATWRPDFARQPLPRLTRRLNPHAPPPIPVRGDRLRVAVTVTGLTTPVPLELEGQLKVPGSSGPLPITFSPRLHNGRNIVTAPLEVCPCQLRELELDGIGGSVPAASGTLTVAGVGEHVHGRWQPVPARLSDAGRWKVPRAQQTGSQLSATPSGLRLDFRVPEGVSPQIATRQPPVPALVTAGVADHGVGKTTSTTGLDGSQINIDPIAIVPVPGAPSNGLVVDRSYAEQSSFGAPYGVQHQVWLTRGAVKSFPAKLRAAGVRITGTKTASGLAQRYSRQGPALALVLFLADAAAAAVLAAAGAVLALYLAGRRRTYELAALAATGARRRSLRGGLLLEQGVTLGFGALVGIGAGILAAYLAVPSVPEFVHPPRAPALLYTPNAGALAAFLAVAVVLLAIAALASVTSLVRAARPDQLREAPA